MKVIFNESGTKENLMRAFAGECQARHRYYFAALTAQEQNLVGLERMFRFTAEQEERHAKQFYELLKEATGTEVNITADYPVNVYTELQKLLDAAARNENSESSEIYPRFAQIAAQEGYPEIQQKFSMIAKIEDSHNRRFEYYAKLMREGMLFIPKVPSRAGSVSIADISTQEVNRRSIVPYAARRRDILSARKKLRLLHRVL